MLQIQHKKVGVIFIDCYENHTHAPWHDRGKPYNNFYKNMLETLTNYDIDSYVFHTTFLNLSWITQDIVNYFKEFASTNNNEQRRQVVNDFLEGTGTEQLSNELHPLTGYSDSMFIPTINGFEKWVDRTGINNWIVVGAHWPVCTHTKPLGFHNLYRLSQQKPYIKIFSIPSCTIKQVDPEGNTVAESTDTTQNSICTSLDYSLDYTLPWIKVEDDLWHINTVCVKSLT